MNCWKSAAVTLAAFFSVVAAPATARAGYIWEYVSWSEGGQACQLCAGRYVCGASFAPYRFTDRVPAGASIESVRVSLDGAGDGGTVQAAINGQPLGTATYDTG